MNWLITGGCGFIGTRLVQYLKRQGGHNIRIIDNLSVGTREDLAAICSFSELTPSQCQTTPQGVELIVGDIREADLALQVTARPMDIIVHLAANTGVGPSVEDPRSDCENNVIGTFNYLEAARINKIPRFIFASSGAPAGEVEPPIHEELPPHPVSPYGASKLAGEGYCSAYHKSFGVDTVALRFGNVYGPASLHKNSAVAKFIKLAVQGQPLEIYGDGTQTRDFIYIDDLVRAICLAATCDGVGGEVFQIATNAETTVGEMIEKLNIVLQRHGIPDTKVIHSSMRLGDVKRNYSDTSKARKRLGWSVQFDLDQGLEETVRYFLSLQ